MEKRPLDEAQRLQDDASGFASTSAYRGWVTNWLPAVGWRRIERTAGAAKIAAAADLRLSLEDDPVLVPLETLPGRDHYWFPPGEEPPWRWIPESR
jgi:hypothetical protein